MTDSNVPNQSQKQPIVDPELFHEGPVRSRRKQRGSPYARATDGYAADAEGIGRRYKGRGRAQPQYDEWEDQQEATGRRYKGKGREEPRFYGWDEREEARAPHQGDSGDSRMSDGENDRADIANSGANNDQGVGPSGLGANAHPTNGSEQQSNAANRPHDGDSDGDVNMDDNSDVGSYTYPPRTSFTCHTRPTRTMLIQMENQPTLGTQKSDTTVWI